MSLVRRMARGPALTEPGLVLASRAAPHIAGLRDAAIAQGRESQEVYGLLRVTAPADIGAHLIAPLLPGFFARHPRVRIEMENTLRLVDLVREGFDLAIRVTMGRLPSSSLTAQEARADESGAVRRDAIRGAQRSAEAPRRAAEPRQRSLLSRQQHARAPRAKRSPKGDRERSRVGQRFLLRARSDYFRSRHRPVAMVLGQPGGGRRARQYECFQSTALSAAPRISSTPAKPVAPKLVRFCAHLLEHVPRLTALP